jgi:hypothetical protein
MYRSRLLIAQLAVVVLLAVGSTGVALAQSGTNYASGGSRLVVVSRSSQPAPAAWTSSYQSLDAAKHWVDLALANTREWVLSFAPARVAVNSRPVAVMRRATR